MFWLISELVYITYWSQIMTWSRILYYPYLHVFELVLNIEITFLLKQKDKKVKFGFFKK